jgi:hypothetical protein
MDIVHPRVAGIDVHKKVIVVAVRLPGAAPGERKVIVKSFKTFWRSLQKMAAWLAELGVTDAAMESTGVILGRQRASATAGDGPGLPVSPSVADGLSGETPPRGQPTTELIPLWPLVDAAFAHPVTDAYVRALPAATPSLIIVTPDNQRVLVAGLPCPGSGRDDRGVRVQRGAHA